MDDRKRDELAAAVRASLVTRLEELVGAHVAPLRGYEPYGKLDDEIVLCAALVAALRALIEDGRFGGAGGHPPEVLLSRISEITQVVSCAIDDLLDASGFKALLTEGDPQTQLKVWLEIFRASVWPDLRSSNRIMLLPLPAGLAAELRDAIEALGEGEVLPLLEPKPTARKGRVYTLDKMRLRALMHVYFMWGQGMTKKIAKARVAAACHASVSTITDEWEPRFREARELAEAKRAGELEVAIRLGCPPDERDASVEFIRRDLAGEVLAEFGQAFRELNTKLATPPA